MSDESDRRWRYGVRDSDPGAASAARVYDYVLGGEHNFEVDQEAGEQLVRIFPWVRAWARNNRAWVQRAVRALVRDGVRQFLDIGSGIPATGNVHEVAQSIVPTVRVVYVDYEKVAVNLGRDILATNPFATSVHADMRQPESVLENPETRAYLDFSEPVAMIWGSMLHFIEDPDDPFGIFGRYKEMLKPGDYVALSHFAWDYLEGEILERAREAVNTYNEIVAQTITFRELKTISRFFDGTEMIEPGVVPTPDWRPDAPNYKPDPDDPARLVMVGGVGRLR